MSSKFEQCKSTGYLEKVSAGEVCSLTVAKAMGIDNIVKNDHYKREYGNVKTYNPQKDALENRVNFELCSPNKNETKAYPLCPLQPGAGFGFTEEYVDKIDNYACVTSECPKDFKVYQDKDGNPDQFKCVKPKLSKTSPLGKYNQERWYDWFTIPEYHLGNGFNSSNNVNYRPCEKGSVPLYTTDPVDGLSVGFDATYNRMDRCVSKGDYFGGKYADGPSYCPIAWIVRAGATKKDYVGMYTDMLDKLDDTGTPAPGLDTLRKNITGIVERDIYDPIQKEGYRNIIGPLLTEEDEVACNSMMRDTERVNATYNICKTLQDNPDGFKDRLRRDITEESRRTRMSRESIEKKVTTRFERTRQACHTVFCDPEGAGMSQVESGTPICYPDVEKANMEIEIKDAEEQEREARKALPRITSDTDKEKAKQTATKGVLQMIKTVLMIIAIVFIYYKVWPFVKKIYETQIKPLFSRHAKTAQQLEAEEATRDLIDMYRPPKPSSPSPAGTSPVTPSAASSNSQGQGKGTGKGSSKPKIGKRR